MKPKAKDAADGFDEFYAAYPRKKKRPLAHKAWKALKPTPETQRAILADVLRKANSHDWTKEGRQFCPYPAAYINGREWEDAEHEASGAAGQAGASGGREALKRERAAIVCKPLGIRTLAERKRLAEIDAAPKEGRP